MRASEQPNQKSLEPVVVNKKSLSRVQDIASELFTQLAAQHTHFLLFKALHTYISSRGGQPGFEVQSDD